MSLNDLKFAPTPGFEREHTLRELMHKAENLGEQARMESAEMEMDMTTGSKMQGLIDEAIENGLGDTDITKFSDAWCKGWKNRDALLRLVIGEKQ